MKADLTKLNPEHFNVYEKNTNGEIVYLVTSRGGATWTKDNLIFRSSVWNKDGELISASFQKFFNWDEQPLINPAPASIVKCHLIEKIDGSTLIVSKYKTNFIIRTRRTIDVFNCANVNEIEIFQKVYPKVFEVTDTNCSYIYEWVSPTNRIVLDYKQPDLYLTAVIRHFDYSMLSQSELDELAVVLKVKRPRVFKMNTLDDMFATVKDFKGVEGICVYYNHDQNIRKVKSAEYLMLHSFKYALSLENVLEMFLKYNQPKYSEFLALLTHDFDWECIEFVKAFASKICDASNEVQKIISAMKAFANNVKLLPRKAAAEKIIAAYGKTSRSGLVFVLLNNKQIDKDNLKKLYFQVLYH